jgi:hypothetical protein
MFPMEKLRDLWTIIKNIEHLLWKNMYFMNMWKRARGGTCQCKKFKETKTNENQQKKGKMSLLFLSFNFCQQSTLQQSWPCTTCLSWRPSFIHCNRVLFDVFYWKSLAKVHGFKIIFQFCVSILTSIGDSVLNILKKCFAITCFMCYMHNIFQSLDVSWWAWHFCHGCQFYQQFLEAHMS